MNMIPRDAVSDRVKYIMDKINSVRQQRLDEMALVQMIIIVRHC